MGKGLRPGVEIMDMRDLKETTLTMMLINVRPIT
jgi:hypothetical protein